MPIITFAGNVWMEQLTQGERSDMTGEQCCKIRCYRFEWKRQFWKIELFKVIGKYLQEVYPDGDDHVREHRIEKSQSVTIVTVKI
jgi:hypothetical protein